MTENSGDSTRMLKKNLGLGSPWFSHKTSVSGSGMVTVTAQKTSVTCQLTCNATDRNIILCTNQSWAQQLLTSNQLLFRHLQYHKYCTNHNVLHFSAGQATAFDISLQDKKMLLKKELIHNMIKQIRKSAVTVSIFGFAVSFLIKTAVPVRFQFLYVQILIVCRVENRLSDRYCIATNTGWLGVS